MKQGFGIHKLYECHKPRARYSWFCSEVNLVLGSVNPERETAYKPTVQVQLGTRRCLLRGTYLHVQVTLRAA